MGTYWDRGLARSSRHRVKPSMRGMTTSAMTRSGSFDQQCRQASTPSAASMIAKPSASSSARMMARMMSSSSTIRMEAFLASLSNGLMGLSGHANKAFEGGGELAVQGGQQRLQGAEALLACQMFDFSGALGQAVGAQRRGAGPEAVGDAPQFFRVAGGELLVEGRIKPGRGVGETRHH